MYGNFLTEWDVQLYVVYFFGAISSVAEITQRLEVCLLRCLFFDQFELQYAYKLYIYRKKTVASVLQIVLRDDEHMMCMNIVEFSRPLIPLAHLGPIFFHHLDLRRPISNKPPSSSPNDNQSIKRKPNPRITISVIRSFRSVFVFSINSLTLSGFPLTSFHLAEVTLSAFFVALYSYVCSCPKIWILFIIIHIFSTHFAINLSCFHNMKM